MLQFPVSHFVQCGAVVYHSWASSRLSISGSYSETRSSSSKKLPLFNTSGLCRCPHNGISFFAQNRTRSITIMMCCLCLSMKDLLLTALFSWFIIFLCPGWTLLKTIHFPQLYSMCPAGFMFATTLR